ncbi:hypothetical protein LMG19083_01906 [Ralstonia psammae]|uniref:Uncharacterized protein n=1 Tax=Ralstonia psammae TaxID=3058598 RepID=A0ABN9IQ60_9RALS|nr:hypothetical protein LMG19083_01906 [Ralstonia sp. LMG 19083]
MLRRPVESALVALVRAVLQLGEVARVVDQLDRAVGIAPVLLRVAVGGAYVPVGRGGPAQFGADGFDLGFVIRAARRHTLAAVNGARRAHELCHRHAKVLARDDAVVRALHVALHVQAIKRPLQIRRDARIERQRCGVALDMAAVDKGVAFFVHHTQARAQRLGWAEAAAHIHRFLERAAAGIAERGAAAKGIARALGHKVGNAARRAEAIHETRQTLEQFHALEVFERHVAAPVGYGQAVDLIALQQVELQAANGDVRCLADVAVVVGRDCRIALEHLADGLRLAVLDQLLRGDVDRERRVEQGLVTQRAGAGLLCTIGGRFGCADLRGGQVDLRGGLLCQRRCASTHGGGCQCEPAHQRCWANADGRTA